METQYFSIKQKKITLHCIGKTPDDVPIEVLPDGHNVFDATTRQDNGTTDLVRIEFPLGLLLNPGPEELNKIIRPLLMKALKRATLIDKKNPDLIKANRLMRAFSSNPSAESEIAAEKAIRTLINSPETTAMELRAEKKRAKIAASTKGKPKPRTSKITKARIKIKRKWKSLAPTFPKAETRRDEIFRWWNLSEQKRLPYWVWISEQQLQDYGTRKISRQP